MSTFCHRFRCDKLTSIKSSEFVSKKSYCMNLPGNTFKLIRHLDHREIFVKLVMINAYIQ